MTALLVKLGSGEWPDGHKTMYALIDGPDRRVAHVMSAHNDDEAVVAGRGLASDGDVECEPALAAVAQRRRAPARPLTTAELQRKANLACAVFEEGTFRDVRDDDAALLDFFAAAATFARAVADDRAEQWHFGGRVSGTIGEAQVDRELFLLVEPGTSPKLHVLTSADARDVFARDADLVTADHLTVDLVGDDHVLIEMIDAAYGLTAIPLVILVEDGDRRLPRPFDLELLAALLLLLARQVTDGWSGFAYRPKIGGSLRADLFEWAD